MATDSKESSDNDLDQTASTSLTGESVADYLKQHPDFFRAYPSLITKLNFPHDTGAAISLVERQVSQLRDQNQALQMQMTEFIENARSNERLLDQFQELLSTLIQLPSIDECIEAMESSFLKGFNIDFCGLFLFNSNPGPAPKSDRLKTLDKSAEVEIRAFLGSGSVVSGSLPVDMRGSISPDPANLASSAIMYLNDRKYRAIVVLGSRDEEHYRTDMSTSMLRYMGSSLTAVFSRFFTK